MVLADGNFGAETNAWAKRETRGAFVKRRYRHSACVYRDKMYIFGGSFVDTCYNDFYSFDFCTCSRGRSGH